MLSTARSGSDLLIILPPPFCLCISSVQYWKQKAVKKKSETKTNLNRLHQVLSSIQEVSVKRCEANPKQFVSPQVPLNLLPKSFL